MAIQTCTRCGATYDTHVVDVQQLPRLPQCPAVYLAPPFPLDAGNPECHVSGPCNGKLTPS